MFKQGDKLKFNGCPFETEKDKTFFSNIVNMIHVVKESDGNMIKTNLINDWVHCDWFFFITNNDASALGYGNEKIRQRHS